VIRVFRGSRSSWGRVGLALCLLVSGTVPAGFAEDATMAPTATVLAEQWARTDIERGEWLIGELRCTACHTAPEELAERWDTIDLPDLPSRLSQRPEGFIAEYLESPQKLHPSGTMPDLLGRLPAAEKAQAIRELTAFLNTLVPPAVEEPRPTHPIRFQQGRVLYHRVGCVACHPPFEPAGEIFEPPADAGLDAGSRETGVPGPLRGEVDLVKLRAQWTHESLTGFLLDPRGNEPRRRMPPMNLTSEEAGVIADYLLGRDAGKEGVPGEGGDGAPATPPDERSGGERVAAGRARFEERGCAACHRVEVDGRVLRSKLVAPRLIELGKKLGSASCLSMLGSTVKPAFGPGERTRPQVRRSAPLRNQDAVVRGIVDDASGDVPADRRGRRSEHARARVLPEPEVMDAPIGMAVPQYALNHGQIAAMRAALLAFTQGLPKLTAADRVHGTLARFNCLACHERGGRGGPNGEQARYFHTLATMDLGWEGWLPPHLNGVGAKLRPEWLQQVLTKGTRVRPYLATHMPTLDPAIAATLIDDLRAADARPGWLEETTPADASAGDGRALLGTEGLACVTCHQFEGRPGLAMNVLDLACTRSRLEWAWFRRYLVDPAALRPGTRMPSFWPEELSALPDILGGDTDRQVAAIWAALQEAGIREDALAEP
jgi:mono/diheme cytochrome c family protein